MFTKGNKLGNGRPQGSPNKTTTKTKEYLPKLPVPMFLALTPTIAKSWILLAHQNQKTLKKYF
jgi:hypothetical protein